MRDKDIIQDDYKKLLAIEIHLRDVIGRLTRELDRLGYNTTTINVERVFQEIKEAKAGLVMEFLKAVDRGLLND